MEVTHAQQVSQHDRFNKNNKFKPIIKALNVVITGGMIMEIFCTTVRLIGYLVSETLKELNL